MKYRVLLYYKFTPVANPQAFRDEHHHFAESHGLKGRVYIAPEGLNGTVAGTLEATDAYKRYISSIEGFQDIEWKEDLSDALPFAKLKTKVKRYLVNFGDANRADPRRGGKHLSPREWREVLETEKDFVMLDVRNNYESEVGHFENAIRPDIENFSDFPNWLKDLLPYKDKKVLMYCTGGIRCEKFSAFLKEEGFDDVNQLKGGILNYVKEEGSKHWKGSCFVFDDRLTVPLDAPESGAAPLSTCKHCGKSENRYLNCSNMTCNALIVCCDACAQAFEGACSEACKNAEGRRPFDPQTFRVPYRKKGIVMPELGLANRKRT